MPMKPRDIREILRSNVHPETIRVIASLAEDMSEIRQQQKAILTLIGRLSDMMIIHTEILGRVKEKGMLEDVNKQISEYQNTSTVVGAEPINDGTDG